MNVYNLDLDEDFLSHLVDPESWDAIKADNISPLLIEDEDVRAIYEWQIEHERSHEQIASPSVLSEEFDLELADPLTAIGDLIDRLRERYIKNEGRKALKSLGTAFQENPSQIPKLLLQEGRKLSSVLSIQGESYKENDFDKLEKRYEKKASEGRGASFGFSEVNDYFYGMKGITFIIGPPKSMKSFIMLNAFADNIREGRNAWFYSLELPAEESSMRLLCLVSGVPYWKYLRNCLNQIDKRELKQASEYLGDLASYNIVKPDKGERGIADLVCKARDMGAEIVFIDQLQYVEGSNGHSLGEMNETGQYWGVLDTSRDLSDSGPICFAHQFNRSAIYAEEMPRVEQAKGSAAIEETATLALGLWANKDMRRSNVLELGTLASRNHTFASWEVGVDLSQGCDFRIIGRSDEE